MSLCSAGKQVGDEDLEEMIESGNPGVFTQGIITDTQQVGFLCCFILVKFIFIGQTDFGRYRSSSQ